MKRLFCLLMLLFLCPGLAAAQSLPELTVVTPAPTAVPAGTEFSCEAFIVYLPAGLEPLVEEDLAAYEAALQAGFPDTAQIQLAAVNAGHSAALCFALMDSVQTPADAAREAAMHILGNSDTVAELAFGANTCAGFACAADDTTYRLYYFSNGTQLLLVSASGLSDSEVDAMLTSLDF